jgi:hypothetical protein
MKNSWIHALTLLILLAGHAGADGRSPGGREEAGKPARAEAAPGVAHIVMLTSIEGLPADSTAALLVLRGIHEAFDRDHFLTEGAGVSKATAALKNEFRLVQGDPWGEEWRLQVTVMGWWGVAGVPPPADTTGARPRGPGCRVNLAVLSARAAEMGARPLPLRVDLEFTPAAAEREGGIFAAAGETIGLIAVEELHRQSGDLDDEVRLRLPLANRRDLIPRRGSGRPSR